jgi:filamentous hemagglutinin family protein
MRSDRNPLRPIIAALLIVAAFLPSAGHAQVTSAITPDGTLGTTVMRSGNLFNINGGRIIGGVNQFHSFGQFSVGTGDIASFNGPPSIQNILSRVTGGNISSIDGTIRSTILGANLFLMNPSGILFGPNAQLDVTGSFHATTADFIGLADGARFNAVPSPADNLLTTAPPAAFGLLNY